MIEVEVKAKVVSFDDVIANLEKLGAKYLEAIHQVDKVFGQNRFLDKEHKVPEGYFSARLRQVNSVITVDFKEILRGKPGLEVSSPVPSIEIGTSFLNKLDFQEAFTVDKVRKNYKLRDFTVSLDDVKDLGHFIEIEHKYDKDEGKDRAMEECIQLLGKIDQGAVIEKDKYGDLMQDFINKSDETEEN